MKEMVPFLKKFYLGEPHTSEPSGMNIKIYKDIWIHCTRAHSHLNAD